MPSNSCASPNVITTVAGGGSPADGLGDNLPATSADLKYPWNVALDSEGNIFIADRTNSRVRKVDVATQIIVTVAGKGDWGYSGDGGLATAAVLNDPWGIAIDGAGNLFIADLENNRVRRVDAASQIITTVAGGGSSTEQNILATAASIYPIGVVIDNAGNLFILDYPVSVRRVDAATRKIVTIAGVGAEWVVFAGDNGPALQAVFNYPRGIALDSSGNLFIADTGNHRIRAVRGPFN